MTEEPTTGASSSPDAADAGAEVVFTVPVECQLRDAEQLLDQLMDAGEAAPVLIDAEGVEVMNSALVLVLASAATSRPKGAPKIAVSNPSSVFTDAFKDMGLFKNLMSMEFRT